ncbi:anti-sigma factor [Paenibacillus sp. PCH8]|uniref:anti-sigma factor family protein n=1 Tax=Paenibacillus sp. PCH8 TaxID=2066524 RepID=UPI000CF97BB4|nr:anti-sigma factor [Paenibacillus sp. PCH8]PQP82018.1 anti-sigma factor [Paenibacillus sp. PCH8]
MNCNEAQELFALVWDLPEAHSQRIAFHAHLAGCEECSEQFEVWEEAQILLHSIPVPVTEQQAERVNRNVMDRIYAESPWLLPEEAKVNRFSAAIRKHMSLWIAAFLAIFLCSFLYMAMFKPNVSEAEKSSVVTTGILETGVAGSASSSSGLYQYNISEADRGSIIEPFVVSVGPAYPQYWMALSLLAIGMALFSLGRMHRTTNKRKQGARA